MNEGMSRIGLNEDIDAVNSNLKVNNSTTQILPLYITSISNLKKLKI